MTPRRATPTRALAVLVIGATATLVAGCTADGRVVEGSDVTVAVDGAFTTLNANSSFGRASAINADIEYLTSTGFAYADDSYGLVRDASFGRAEIVSDEPFTVRYSISDDATWSDGVPVSSADLLLAWAANSRALDTDELVAEDFVDPETGRMGELPDGIVHFDGALGRGLELATRIPELGDDGRTITLEFDEFVPGWLTALSPGLPAHVVAARALELPLRDDGDESVSVSLAAESASALTEAVIDGDVDALSAIADVWNSGFDLTGVVPDADLLVASGPYRVSSVTDGSVTLTANPHYRGSRAPMIETIELRTVVDPDVLTRQLAAGEIDIATPAPDPELATRLADVAGVTVAAGSESIFEHIDLRIAGSKSGHFADARVRDAFMRVVPRQAILDELVAPVQTDAGLLDSFVLRPGATGYEDAVAANGSDAYRATDVAAAVALLAEAGTASPEVCILFDPSDARRAAAFALIRDSAARAGFVVTDCSRADWRGLLGVPGAYDAALFAWDTTRLGAGASSAVFRSDAALSNFTGFADARADVLIDQISATDDEQQIVERLTELDGILWRSRYGVPLFAHPTLTAISDRVEGVTRSPLDRGVLWNAWDWRPANERAGAAQSRPLR